MNLSMEHLLQTPHSSPGQTLYPLWFVFYGVFDKAEQAIVKLGPGSVEHDTFLLAHQATRSCGDGYCWSFARDAKAIQHLIETTCATYPLDRTKLSLLGYSMGCTMGLWLIVIPEWYPE